MRIPLDKTSDQPLYSQIAEYIRGIMAEGQFPVHSRLPSARELARINGVGRITAERAYEQLEAVSLVRIVPGSGVYSLKQTNSLAESECGDSHKYRPFDVISSDGLTDFSFGGGDPRLYPETELRQCMQKASARPDKDLFSYGDLRGYEPLRQSVSEILISQGLRVSPGNILLTNGSQQALSLLCRTSLKAGSVIITEELTYGEALNLFRHEGYRIVPVPMDEDGMRTDKLAEILKSVPAELIYTIPNFHNPTGITLSLERRLELLSLAKKYEIPVIEDDYVGDLSYDSVCPPSLKALAPAQNVSYISTFSKMVMPGLRFGFLAGPRNNFDEIVGCKRCSDLSSPVIIQKALCSFLNLGRYQNHISGSSRIYRKRRDFMISCIRSGISGDWISYIPHGGLFLWINLPAGTLKGDWALKSAETGLKLASPDTFNAGSKSGRQGLRLNFACMDEEGIHAGIGKLKRFLFE